MRAHGVAATYSAGCRCEPCRIAKREAQRAYNKSKRLMDPTDHPRSGGKVQFDGLRLIRAIEASGKSPGEVCRELGMSQSSLQKAIRRGSCMVITLDNVSCHLGRHMSEFEVSK